MFYTYVLKCFNSPFTYEFYVGSCSDLKNRLSEHIRKEVKTTKKFGKIILVYYEACLDKADASRREKELKTGYGKGYIKRRLQKY